MLLYAILATSTTSLGCTFFFDRRVPTLPEPCMRGAFLDNGSAWVSSFSPSHCGSTKLFSRVEPTIFGHRAVSFTRLFLVVATPLPLSPPPSMFGSLPLAGSSQKPFVPNPSTLSKLSSHFLLALES